MKSEDRKEDHQVTAHVRTDVNMDELVRLHERRIASLMRSPERRFVGWFYDLRHKFTRGKSPTLQTFEEYLAKSWSMAGSSNPRTGSKKVHSSDLKRVNALFDKGKGGFQDAAIRELGRYAFSVNADNTVRANASLKIALLALASGQEERIFQAVEDLERFQIAKLPLDLQDTITIMKVKLFENLKGHKAAFPLVEERVRRGMASADLILLGSNCFADGIYKNEHAREDWINKAFSASGAQTGVGRLDPFSPLSIDNLGSATKQEQVDGGPLISVIMPVFNSQEFVATSVKSILAQSWANLELIIIDDCSTDATPEIIRELATGDSRIKVLSTPSNSGPYVARNIGLKAASGAFVTCQDGDDWSHPARLATQAAHLSANEQIVANTSLWARATSDLLFRTREQSTAVVHLNSSSLMFRRDLILRRIGFWDSVRFGGDTEFIKRIQVSFGAEAYVQLDAMLAVSRLHNASITRSIGSEYSGAKVGARKAYWHGYETWHSAAQDKHRDLHIEFPLAKRPFGIPALLDPKTSRTDRHYDVIIYSDFRHLGGNTASNLQELKVQISANISTAIVQVDRFDFNVSRPIHADVQALIDAGQIDVLVAGETATCDLVTIRFPAIFQEPQINLPLVKPRHVRVVVNQPPRRVEGEPPFYSIATCKKNIENVFGTPGEWVPIGPAVRAALTADNQQGHLSSEDWYNIVAIEDDLVTSLAWVDEVPVIGRHGRDNFEKWPTNVEALTGAYPLSDDVRVRILGGASYPISLLGRQPKNWTVYPFNSVAVEDFLKTIDFFVFFPHEGRIEAFGRTIIEAMAASKLVILPSVFRDLFGDAALYCKPGEVKELVLDLYSDKDRYITQVNKAKAIVSRRFGHDVHVTRVTALLGDPADLDQGRGGKELMQGG